MYVKSINVNLTFGAELTDYTAMFSSAHFKEKALKAEEKRAEEGRPRAEECAFRGCVFFFLFWASTWPFSIICSTSKHPY